MKKPFVRDDKELELTVNGVMVWVDYDDVDREQAEKAAYLIAAAKKLFAAAEHVARDSMLNEGGIISHEALGKLRAALTKAKP